MALVSRKEYAEICGVDVNYINTYVTRGKISVLPNKKIDTENPLNVYFKKNLKNLKKEKEAVNKPKAVKPKAAKDNGDLSEFEKKQLEKLYDKVVDKIPIEETPDEKAKRLKQNEDDEESLSWDARKKRADALKAEASAEKERLTVEKLMGNLMPVDMVEQIIKVNLQDVFKTFENESINLASIYCDILANGNRDKLSELIKQLRHKIETIIKKVEITAAQEIENVVNEYIEVRNRGEKK